MMTQIEVLSSPERRRRWSAEQKRSIVAEAFVPGASVCEVSLSAAAIGVVAKQTPYFAEPGGRISARPERKSSNARSAIPDPTSPN